MEREGGGEAGTGLEARLGDVSSNQPCAVPFKDQSWLLAPGSPVVRVMVVEGRGENYSSQQEMRSRALACCIFK